MADRPQTLNVTLRAILNSFIELCECDGGAIYTLRKNELGEDILVFEAMVTRSARIFQVPDQVRLQTFEISSTSLVGKTAALRQAHRVDSSQMTTTGSEHREALKGFETRNILSAPLITPRKELVGVVQLVNKLQPKLTSDTNPSDPTGVTSEFTPKDERLLELVAGQAALAIENSMLLDEQERLLEGFVQACVTAVESRDPVTSGHSNRVAEYTLQLADSVSRVDAGPLRDVHFQQSQMREMRFAALLHDFGKITIKEEILKKEKKLFHWELEIIRLRLKLMTERLKNMETLTGVSTQIEITRLRDSWLRIQQANEPTVVISMVNHLIDELSQIEVELEDGESLRALTEGEGFRLSVPKGTLLPEERLEIERHVTNTYEILKIVPWSKGLERVPEIAYRHHEKLDGSGYPCRCPANQIPVQSRILTICDIYDALTADDRPYKRSVPAEKALDILANEVHQGKLDKAIFQIFLDSKVYEQTAAIQQRAKKAA